LVIATILAHGALITSVGLALAVWIKRQSRAIAFSVGSFVLVTAAWPIFVQISFHAGLGGHLASLSPVVACTAFVSVFTTRRYGIVGGILWSGAFWAVEVFALAMGMLWLTVRTFDGCFDRIPDRPHRVSVWAGVVVIMAGLIGAGSVVGAVDYWIEGVKPGWLNAPASFGALAYSCMIALALVLLAIDLARSGGQAWTGVPDVIEGIRVRKSGLRQWWTPFRLVLLLAIGPAVFALALATARRAPEYEPQFTTDPSGAQVITSYILARTDIPYPGEVRFGRRLLIYAALLATILVHGGAAISVGLALTTANAWLRRALATAVGLTVLGILALRSQLVLLVSRTSFRARETLWSVMFWDVLVILFAVGLSWWTNWIWQRRLRGVTEARSVRATDLHHDRPAVETAWVGD
jgi:hypothetical protein